MRHDKAENHGLTSPMQQDGRMPEQDPTGHVEETLSLVQSPVGLALAWRVVHE